MMKHITELTERFREGRHPGVKLGEFLANHSNSSEYLVGVLSSFLRAAKADLQEERDWITMTLELEKGKNE